MNLLRAEFGRLSARGFVRLMLVLLLAAFAITVATTVAGSHTPSRTEVASAEQQAERQRIESTAYYNACLRARETGLNPEETPYPNDCDMVRPTRYETADFLSGVFVFKKQIKELIYFLVIFLALFGFLVGASYVGADLNSGGMVNLLLWRPRRMVVLGTKLGALLAGVLGTAVAATALYVGAFWLVARTTGLTGDLSHDFWGPLALTTGRGLVLTLVAAALGFAIATVGRHTAAALGVVAAYAVVWELGVRVVMEIVDFVRPEQWMFSSYLGAWMAGRIELWDSHACRSGSYSGGFCESMYSLSWVSALVVLTVVVGAALAAAFVTFRRRDLA